MKVRVKFFASLRELAGKKEEILELDEGSTVMTLLEQLAKIYGGSVRNYIFDEGGRPRDHLQFLIDGRSVATMSGFETKLSDGCSFAIIPPVGGG
jgi:molybdopterin synthase sulfur carrier subunit